MVRGKTAFFDFYVKTLEGIWVPLNYAGFTKDSNQFSADEQLLSDNLRDHLYMAKLPSEIIESKLNTFINNGYR